MIVIAKDRMDTVRRLQTSDDFRARRRIRSFLRNVVSGQGNQIRIEIICDRDGAIEMARLNHWPVMQIGKVNYSESVQRLRQPPQIDLLPLDCNHERLRERHSRHFSERRLKQLQRPRLLSSTRSWRPPVLPLNCGSHKSGGKLTREL